MPSSEQAPILVVAALSYELKELHRAPHPRLALLETGEGVSNAKRHLEAWLVQHHARAVLSIGFAGALSAVLQPGDLVIARDVHHSNEKPDAKLISAAIKVKLDTPVHLGVAVTSLEILWKGESKLALASSLEVDQIGFVDMESTAIAEVCASRGVPYLIVRSISDLLDEDLPLDFNRYRTDDGRVDRTRVAKAAMMRPATLKALFQLKKRSDLCARRMAEFVKRFVPLIG